jgi:hypothetical protein
VSPCHAGRTKPVHLQRRHDPPGQISKLPFRGCSPKRPCRGPFYAMAPLPAWPPHLAVHHQRAVADLQPFHESPGCLGKTGLDQVSASAATSPQPANLRIGDRKRPSRAAPAAPPNPTIAEPRRQAHGEDRTAPSVARSRNRPTLYANDQKQRCKFDDGSLASRAY